MNTGFSCECWGNWAAQCGFALQTIEFRRRATRKFKEAAAVGLLIAASPCLPANSYKATQEQINSYSNPTVLPRGYRSDSSTETWAWWDVGDEWRFFGKYECSSGKAYDFWPLDPICKGIILIEHQNRSTNTLLALKGKMPTLTIRGERVDFDKMFDTLADQDNAILEANGWSFELENFRELKSDKYMEAARIEANQERASIAVTGILTMLGVAGLLIFIKILFLRIRRKAPAALAHVSNGIAKITQEHEKAKIRRTVIDETIRQTTRSALAEISDAEKAALRGQIKMAVDSGNHELVKSLTGILEKIDKV